jgi:fluoride ion exporter CrcB/FEX
MIIGEGAAEGAGGVSNVFTGRSGGDTTHSTHSSYSENVRRIEKNTMRTCALSAVVSIGLAAFLSGQEVVENRNTKIGFDLEKRKIFVAFDI